MIKKKLWKLQNNLKHKLFRFLQRKNLHQVFLLKMAGFVYHREQIMKIADILLPGTHNLENILSAVAAAKLSGVSNEAIYKVLNTFNGVKHRLQFIEEIQGRKFYNDSKATNILSN